MTDALFSVGANVNCVVESSLPPNVLVVSFRHEDGESVFRGALIRTPSTPSSLPVFDFSVGGLANRITYNNKTAAESEKEAPPRRNSVSVRLRARRVLCDQCGNVCDESGKNVRSKSRLDRLKAEAAKDKLRPMLKRLKTPKAPNATRKELYVDDEIVFNSSISWL